MSREAQRPKPRIESLSDLIFGLALSIGALILITNRPTDLLGLAVNIGIFGFSFLILISIWFRYTEIMSVLPFETTRTRVLNTTLLFLVVIEPYMFSFLSFTPSPTGLSLDVATTGYALDIGAVYTILAVLSNALAAEERVLAAGELVKKYRVFRNQEIVVAAVFFISSLPVFSGNFPVNGGIPTRFYIWWATFVLRRSERILGRFTRSS